MKTKNTLTYDFSEINKKNHSQRWNNTIHIPKKYESEKSFKIIPTGDADSNGRKYVAIPTNTVVTDKLKASLNLF
jgi:hypothetical protein